MLPITEPRCRWPSLDILMLVSSKTSLTLLFYDEVWFICIYIITNFFPSSSRSDHHFFGDSTVPMPFKSSANATCLEEDVLLPSFDFLFSHASRAVMPSAYIAIVVGSPCVAPSSDFMNCPPLNIKTCLRQVAVIDICWYWWGKCFCIMKKCLPIYFIKGIWSHTINTASVLSLLRIS